ncbi:MAG TPA: carbohydrate-binding protein [Polyangiaceae bacterium]|nr:carbohydrate-binding protein [Polyangiaceae bacterium]
MNGDDVSELGDEASLGQVHQALNSVSYVSGNTWYVDGNPWLMKGVNWDPSEPCEWYTQYNWERAAGDAQIMKDNGFNTIRTYGFTSAKSGLADGGQITLAQLDAFYSRGIRVILAVHSAPGDSTWTGAGYSGTNILPSTGDFTQAAKDRITMLANHPAVIALGVGNEVRYNFFYTADPGGAWSNGWTVDNVVQHANYVTSKVRPLTDKPVTVSWGNTWDINKVGQLTADIISYQIYNQLSLDNIFNLHPQYSTKPFYMSEFGADAFNATTGVEDEVSQRVGNNTLFKMILDNATTGANGTASHKIVGGSIFSFSDGWWKMGSGNACNQETGGVAPGGGPYPDLTFNEEYWGLCRGDGATPRSCRQSLGDLKNLFAGYGGGGGGQPPPGRSIASNLEAESYEACYNVGSTGGEAPCSLEATTDTGGGKNIGWIDNGDYLEWLINVPSTGAYTVTTRSATTANSTYEILVDGVVVATKTTGNTGGWQTWQDFTTSSFNMTAGNRTLRIRFTSGGQNMNWLKVNSAGSPVTVYHDPAYAGVSAGLALGDYNMGQLNALGIANDQISSLKVSPGYQVVLYQHIDFGGFAGTFTGDVSDLASSTAGRTSGTWNNDTTSLRVQTAAAPDTTAPSVPGSLATSGITSSAVTLSWAASTDNVGVTGYRVFRGTTDLGTTTSTSYTFTGLTASTAYALKVQAYDAAGNNSAQASVNATTAAAADTTAPSVPGSLATSNITSSAITLGWAASTDNVGVTGYRVFLGTTDLGTTTSTSYTFSGLTASTAYTLKVQAYDAAGNNSSQASVNATTAAGGGACINISSNVAFTITNSYQKFCLTPSPSSGNLYTDNNQSTNAKYKLCGGAEQVKSGWGAWVGSVSSSCNYVEIMNNGGPSSIRVTW